MRIRCHPCKPPDEFAMGSSTENRTVQPTTLGTYLGSWRIWRRVIRIPLLHLKRLLLLVQIPYGSIRQPAAVTGTVGEADLWWSFALWIDCVLFGWIRQATLAPFWMRHVARLLRDMIQGMRQLMSGAASCECCTKW